jgi:hypothetical protein
MDHHLLVMSGPRHGKTANEVQKKYSEGQIPVEEQSTEAQSAINPAIMLSGVMGGVSTDDKGKGG